MMLLFDRFNFVVMFVIEILFKDYAFTYMLRMILGTSLFFPTFIRVNKLNV